MQNVNIELGEDISKFFYEASKLTYANRPEFLTQEHESFSGFRAINLSNFGNNDYLLINMGFDGVGTKIEVSERLNSHSTVAFDLFAMVCDDAVVRGGEPVAIGSILEINNLNNSKQCKKAIKELATGYIEAAKAAKVVVVNGEIAEVGTRVNGYGSFNYNWGATVLWVVHKERALSGHNIKPGHSLIGLAEPGFRSNGLTDVRNILEKEYGPDWHNNTIKELGGSSLGRLVQQPSTIFCRFITTLNGGFDIHTPPQAKITGAAHITGGGIPSKVGRMLEPSGLGAEIDNPISPSRLMLHVQEKGGLPDKKAYAIWNMGHGMVIATPEPDKVLAAAKSFGINAKHVGTVTKNPKIKIKNCGAVGQETWLQF